jgi:SSS family solute:Na+ symporter
MSSLDSQFLCLGTMFTEDVVQPLRGEKRLSDRQELLVARLFIIAIVAVTYALSLAEPRRVFTLGVWCFSGFSSLFPLIVAALYWPRLTRAGAYACVIAAAGSWLWLFAASDFAAQPDFTVNLPVPAAIDADGSWQLMPVAAMITVSTMAMVVVSLLTSPPRRQTLDRFFPPAG